MHIQADPRFDCGTETLDLGAIGFFRSFFLSLSLIHAHSTHTIRTLSRCTTFSLLRLYEHIVFWHILICKCAYRRAQSNIE